MQNQFNNQQQQQQYYMYMQQQQQLQQQQQQQQQQLQHQQQQHNGYSNQQQQQLQQQQNPNLYNQMMHIQQIQQQNPNYYNQMVHNQQQMVFNMNNMTASAGGGYNQPPQQIMGGNMNNMMGNGGFGSFMSPNNNIQQQPSPQASKEKENPLLQYFPELAVKQSQPQQQPQFSNGILQPTSNNNVPTPTIITAGGKRVPNYDILKDMIEEDIKPLSVEKEKAGLSVERQNLSNTNSPQLPHNTQQPTSFDGMLQQQPQQYAQYQHQHPQYPQPTPQQQQQQQYPQQLQHPQQSGGFNYPPNQNNMQYLQPQQPSNTGATNDDDFGDFESSSQDFTGATIPAIQQSQPQPPPQQQQHNFNFGLPFTSEPTKPPSSSGSVGKSANNGSIDNNNINNIQQPVSVVIPPPPQDDDTPIDLEKMMRESKRLAGIVKPEVLQQQFPSVTQPTNSKSTYNWSSGNYSNIFDTVNKEVDFFSAPTLETTSTPPIASTSSPSIIELPSTTTTLPTNNKSTTVTATIAIAPTIEEDFGDFNESTTTTIQEDDDFGDFNTSSFPPPLPVNNTTTTAPASFVKNELNLSMQFNEATNQAFGNNSNSGSINKDFTFSPLNQVNTIELVPAVGSITPSTLPPSLNSSASFIQPPSQNNSPLPIRNSTSTISSTTGITLPSPTSSRTKLPPIVAPPVTTSSNFIKPLSTSSSSTTFSSFKNITVNNNNNNNNNNTKSNIFSKPATNSLTDFSFDEVLLPSTPNTTTKDTTTITPTATKNDEDDFSGFTDFTTAPPISSSNIQSPFDDFSNTTLNPTTPISHSNSSVNNNLTLSTNSNTNNGLLDDIYKSLIEQERLIEALECQQFMKSGNANLNDEHLNQMIMKWTGKEFIKYHYTINHMIKLLQSKNISKEKIESFFNQFQYQSLVSLANKDLLLAIELQNKSKNFTQTLILNEKKEQVKMILSNTDPNSNNSKEINSNTISSTVLEPTISSATVVPKSAPSVLMNQYQVEITSITLQHCLDELEQSLDVLMTIKNQIKNDIVLAKRVKEAPKYKEFLSSLSEIYSIAYQVNHTIQTSLQYVNNNNNNNSSSIFKKLNNIWNSILPFFQDIQLQYYDGMKSCNTTPISENQKSCYICGTALDNFIDNIAQHNSHFYHMKCANFWANIINVNLPS